MVSLPGPAKATYIFCIVEFDDLADNLLCSQMYADNHRIESKGRKNLKTNNFENFVFLRIFCIFLYLFVFICIFLYCYFFVLSEKIGRHEYKKIQKKHAFSPDDFNALSSVAFFEYSNKIYNELRKCTGALDDFSLGMLIK